MMIRKRPRPRLRQQACGWIEARGRTSVGGKPRDLPAAAAADIGRPARTEKALQQRMKIVRGWLGMPIGREIGCRSVVCRYGNIVHIMPKNQRLAKESARFAPIPLMRAYAVPAESG
jgi:hypothetical protein